MFEGRLKEVALETISKICQGRRVRADVTAVQQRCTTTLDDDGHVVTHLEQGLLLMRDVHALHQALNSRDEGVITGPKVPVGDCWLTSSVTNLSLEFVEYMARPTDECSYDFDARWTDSKDWGEEADEQKEEVNGRTHRDGDGRVGYGQIDKDRRRDGGSNQELGE